MLRQRTVAFGGHKRSARGRATGAGARDSRIVPFVNVTTTLPPACISATGGARAREPRDGVDVDHAREWDNRMPRSTLQIWSDSGAPGTARESQCAEAPGSGWLLRGPGEAKPFAPTRAGLQLPPERDKKEDK